MKNVKIKFDIRDHHSQGFLTNILSDLCVIKEVQDDEEIFFHSAYIEKIELNKKRKTIIFGGENVWIKHNIISTFFVRKYIREILLRFCRYIPSAILNIKTGYYRPWFVKIITDIQKGHHKNVYALISNDTKADNIFNMPYFIPIFYKLTKGFEGFNKEKNIDSIPKKFCCAIVSNPMSVERNEFYKALSKYKQVDIYGNHFWANADNSKIPPRADFDLGNHNLYKEYKFVICFENSYSDEYITEKLPEVMRNNVVPIYRGASNTGDYFNTKSFINYDDYGSYDKMIDKIKKLDNDDEKYKAFLKTPWMSDENKAYIESKKQGLKDFLERAINA